DWHGRINLLFRSLVEDYSPDDFIVDKTPTIEPLYALQHIEAMWPHAKFVFCRRRGIDNVISKQRKWPAGSFESQCREWAAVNDLWDEKKKDLQANWIEVDFFDLLADVQGLAARIGTLLALSEEDVARIAGKLGATRPQNASSGGSGFVRFSETGWTDEQSKLFTGVCGPTMERCGYGLSEYWQSERSG
ncbi:MAG TPA: sulfotransferase, partial [Rhizomicrobium sp.]|nr:sulfotransferase [Rhizomicrobium sp.]